MRTLFVVTVAVLACGVGHAADRPGVAPADPWSCPPDHPIKGYVAAEPHRRLYFVPGGRYYEEASPERCYASEDEARRDGGVPAKERAPSRVPRDHFA